MVNKKEKGKDMTPKGNFPASYVPKEGTAVLYDKKSEVWYYLTIEGKIVTWADVAPADTPRMPTIDWLNWSTMKAKAIVASFGNRVVLEVDTTYQTPVFEFHGVDDNGQVSKASYNFDVSDFMLRFSNTGDMFSSVRTEIINGLKQFNVIVDQG